MALLGLAGVGKSNLIAVLCDPQWTARHLAGARRPIHFIPVDTTVWDQTPHHLWDLMLTALNGLLGDPSADFGSRIVPMDRAERTLGRLTSAVAGICQKRSEQVVFIFDDIDTLLTTGPLPMLEQLNALRSQGNRERLSYLLFAKRLPHILGRNMELESRSKFYDLFRHDIYALGPYIWEDAMQMARHLNETQGEPLSDELLKSVVTLSGGHGGLLKVLFTLCLTSHDPALNGAESVCDMADVQQECRRILRGLHRSERRTALAIAEDRIQHEDMGHIDHLRRRGILSGSAPLRWFSPILPHYLRRFGIELGIEEKGSP